MCVSFKYVRQIMSRFYFDKNKISFILIIFYFDIIVFYCFDLCPPFCVKVCC